jgi:hypothetical protein
LQWVAGFKANWGRMFETDEEASFSAHYDLWMMMKRFCQMWRLDVFTPVV